MYVEMCMQYKKQNFKRQNKAVDILEWTKSTILPTLAAICLAESYLLKLSSNPIILAARQQ